MHRSPRKMQTLVISEVPTPQRIPTFNSLSSLLPDVTFIYMLTEKTDRGWGNLNVEHEARYWCEMRIGERLQLLRTTALRGKESVAVCFGWRGPLRIAAILGSRVFGSPLVLRSDTNQRNIVDGSRIRRALRRGLLRLMIPPSATAWTIGTENERFWKEEVRVTNVVRIPYEVPLLPGLRRANTVSRRRSDPLALRFIYVGRLSPEKRVMDAIRAFKDLRDTEHARWSLQIIGTGPCEPELRQAAEGDSRIAFAGSVDYVTLGGFLEESDVLILPSSREPWGLVVNEALGYGLYVIASDAVGAAIDMLTGSNGSVYPARNVGALRECLGGAANYLERVPQRPATDTATLMAEGLRAYS